MVKLNSKIMTISAIPETTAPSAIAINNLGQSSGHDKQRELPRDKLRPGLQLLHSNPVRFKAHWVSAPLGIFRSMLTFCVDGKQ